LAVPAALARLAIERPWRRHAERADSLDPRIGLDAVSETSGDVQRSS
jgi:hypothetical protein